MTQLDAITVPIDADESAFKSELNEATVAVESRAWRLQSDRSEEPRKLGLDGNLLR
jgi:hypothetical protein